MSTLTRQSAQRSVNGHRPATVAMSRARNRSLPWLALGIVLVLGGALAAGLLVQSAGERVPVVATARPITQGQVITAQDLRVVEVAVDGEAATVPGSARAGLVGQRATTRIPEGALLAPGQIGPTGGLEPGMVIVGAPLAPGQVPIPNLQPGHRVRMVSAGTDGLELEVLGPATVYSVSPISSGSTFVALVVPDEVADGVTEVVAAGRLRLVLLPGED